MKLITRDTGYAVSALCYIAKNKGRKVSVYELTRQLRIPRYFLRKIIVAVKALACKLAKACYFIMRDQVDFDVRKMFG